jgi:hypothetical protein
MCISALNDDSWHTVDIFLETTTGKLVVTLDDLPSTSRYLRAYTQIINVRDVLDWTQLKSVVSYAGINDIRLKKKICSLFFCFLNY